MRNQQNSERGHNFLAPIPIKKILPQNHYFLGRILDLKKLLEFGPLCPLESYFLIEAFLEKKVKKVDPP